MKRKSILLVLCLIFIVKVYAQKDFTRWAFEAGVGTSSVQAADDGWLPYGGDDGNSYHFRLEYYLTQRNVLFGGFQNEELSYNSRAYNHAMPGLELGAKHYFLPKKWIVQAYVAGSAIINLGSQIQKGLATDDNSSGTIMYLKYDSRAPRLSLSPQIGADLYLFSHVALTFEYDWRFGIDSRTRINLTSNQGGHWYQKDYATRSCFHIGLRFTFPFSASSKEVNSLYWLLNTFISSHAGQ